MQAAPIKERSTEPDVVPFKALAYSDIQERQVYCRWSQTLGLLEATHQEIWGTMHYCPERNPNHIGSPTVFFGIYGLPDFFALWRHQGKKWILWAGSDIQHFLAGYFLDPEGSIRISAHQLAPWIDTYCESYVENDVEKAALASVGIRAKVVPSFLGQVTAYPQSYTHSERPKLYTSVSGDNFKLYGWDKIPELARENPSIEFYLYGATDPRKVEEALGLEPGHDLEKAGLSNVFDRGRVPKEQMNEEIKDMQGALRLTTFDGFSEILAKSVLMGQWPVSLIEYPCMIQLDHIGLIHSRTEANVVGREYYQRILNQYPWNLNRHA